MRTVVVGSANPVKVRAVRRAFDRLFGAHAVQVVGLPVPSGVAEQPRTDAETRAGAEARAERLGELRPEADFRVGIEGGVEEGAPGMSAFAWVVVRSHDLVGRARSGSFVLPPSVADLVRAGHELGVADDMVFQQRNSKRDAGAIGLLTGGVVDRAALYEHAVVLALVPFKNPDLYAAPAAGDGAADGS